MLCNTGGLEEIPIRQIPENVEELSLIKNNFSELRPDAFSGLRYLKRLSLDGNNITTIKPFAFRGLSRLRNLSIQHTLLPFIEKFSFAALQNLTLLDLSNNRIRYIQEYSFVGSSNIRAIYFGNNPLLRIHSNAFSGLNSVDKLTFPSGIREIEPDAFNGLQAVKQITLNHLDLRFLAAFTFRGMTDVHELNLQECDLGHVMRDAFAGMAQVRQLNLIHNKIDRIEELQLTPDNAVGTLVFSNNHVLETAKAQDVTVRVARIIVKDNYFPCNCQIHDILDSEFVNGSLQEFRHNNFCISPLEYTGKSLGSIDFHAIASCHDKAFQDNLGSGVVSLKCYPILSTVFLLLQSYSTALRDLAL